MKKPKLLRLTINQIKTSSSTMKWKMDKMELITFLNTIQKYVYFETTNFKRR